MNMEKIMLVVFHKFTTSRFRVLGIGLGNRERLVVLRICECQLTLTQQTVGSSLTTKSQLALFCHRYGTNLYRQKQQEVEL